MILVKLYRVKLYKMSLNESNLKQIRTCDDCDNVGKRIRHAISCSKYKGKKNIKNETYIKSEKKVTI